MSLLALALALVVVLLPWTTWVRAPGLDALQAVRETPRVVLLVAVTLLASAWVVTVDRWLGAFLALVTLQAVRLPWALLESTVLWTATGVLVLLAARRLTPRLRRVVVAALVIAAVAEIGYAALQLARWDPLWLGWTRAPHALFVHGTLGRSGYLGLYLALVAPLDPLALAPVFLVGAVLAKSALPAVALGVGLVVRAPRVWWTWAGSAVALAAVWLVRGEVARPALENRLGAWVLGWQTWWDTNLWLGVGPGTWPLVVPLLQRERGLGEVFTLGAHNDYLQLGFEYGLLGLACLAGFAWAHRRAWRGPYRGALAALALVGVGWFPWHLAPTAMTGALVLGLATAEPA